MTRHQHSCGHVHDCEAPAPPVSADQQTERVAAIARWFADGPCSMLHSPLREVVAEQWAEKFLERFVLAAAAGSGQAEEAVALTPGLRVTHAGVEHVLRTMDEAAGGGIYAVFDLAALADRTPGDDRPPCRWHANRCEALNALCLVDCAGGTA